jgi:hypothetical protein
LMLPWARKQDGASHEPQPLPFLEILQLENNDNNISTYCKSVKL